MGGIAGVIVIYLTNQAGVSLPPLAPKIEAFRRLRRHWDLDQPEPLFQRFAQHVPDRDMHFLDSGSR